MSKKSFTGESLAKSMHLDLTDEEINEAIDNGEIKSKAIGYGFWSKLRRRIWPRKIFYIKFADGHGVIIMADNEEDACVESAYDFGEGRHHCQNPFFDKSCEQCRKIFNDDADRINHATVKWLGWGCPDYNWAIHT